MNLNEELNPYISALVHRDGEKVQAYVPADSLVANKDFRQASILGWFKLDLRFDLRQPVNQWISIILLGCLTLAILLYYFTHNAFEVADNLVGLAPVMKME